MPSNRQCLGMIEQHRQRLQMTEPHRHRLDMVELLRRRKRAISALAMAQASLQPACRQYWVFWEAMGKLMQWQAWIWSCSVNGSLSACQFAFYWDDDGFSCSYTVANWNLSLSLSHEYHHQDSLELTNRKDGSKYHFLECIEEAYYLVEVMLLCLSLLVVVIVVLARVIWWLHQWHHTELSLVAFLKCFWWGICVFGGAYDNYLCGVKKVFNDLSPKRCIICGIFSLFLVESMCYLWILWWLATKVYELVDNNYNLKQEQMNKAYTLIMQLPFRSNFSWPQL
jgi:hypothetical protein